MVEGINETVPADQAADFEQVRAKLRVVSPDEVAGWIDRLAGDEVAATVVESIRRQRVAADELAALEASLEEKKEQQQGLEQSLMEIKSNYSQTIATIDLEGEALDQREREVLATKVIIYRGNYNATVKTFNQLQIKIAQLTNRRTQLKTYFSSPEYVSQSELLQRYQQAMGSVALLAETLQQLSPLHAVPPLPSDEHEPVIPALISGSIDALGLDGIAPSQRRTVYYDVVMPTAVQDAVVDTIATQEQARSRLELPPLLLPAQLQKRLDDILAAAGAPVREVAYE